MQLTKPFPDPSDTWKVELADAQENIQAAMHDRDHMKDCDLILFFGGANEFMMREGYHPLRRGDNADLSLKCGQSECIEILAQTGKPIVLVLFGGGPQVVERESRLVQGLLSVFFMGQETGDALVDLFTGMENPSGKLSVSFPRDERCLPCFYNHKPTARLRGYLFEDVSPLYPFGYGLSYTQFRYENFHISADCLHPGESLSASIRISNVGQRAGTEIVQLYLHKLHSLPVRPVKELIRFTRIFLEPGESREVTFQIQAQDCSYYCADGSKADCFGQYELMAGGSSQETLSCTFVIR